MELFKLLGTIAIENNEANNALDDTTDKAEGSESKISAAFKKIGAAVVAALAVDKILNFGQACVEAAADVKAMNAQYEQTFGKLSDQATKAIQKVASESGILETRLKGVGTSIYAFAKSSGAKSSEAMSLMETALQATADAAAYYDRSLEDTSESLQSFLKGNFANDAALGVSCTETTRNAAAMKLFGQEYNNLTEIQKQQTLLKMVTDAQQLSGAMGQAAREADGWENVIGNLKESWKQFMAVLGGPVLSSLIPIIQNATAVLLKMGEAIQKVQQFFEKHKTLLSVITVLITTLTVAIIAYNVALHASTIAHGLLAAATAVSTAATTAFGATLAFVTSPIFLVIAAIGALIAIGIALYQNWDKICKAASSLWTTIKTVFENIKNTISNIMNAAANIVKSAIDKIRSFFNFHWELPKIKLPHFNIKGQFSLNPPSIPSFSVDWYKKAMDNPMIMTEPTAFGISPSGQIRAGGEAGSEVVSGTDTLMNMISDAVASQNVAVVEKIQRLIDILATFFPQILESMGMSVVLDSGALVGELAPGIDTELGKISGRKARWT